MKGGRQQPAWEASPQARGVWRARMDASSFGVLIESERDQRVFDWMVNEVGEAGIQVAVGQVVASGRRLYVSNIAKALGLEVPASLARTPVFQARARIAAIRSALLKPGVAE